MNSIVKFGRKTKKVNFNDIEFSEEDTRVSSH